MKTACAILISMVVATGAARTGAPRARAARPAAPGVVVTTVWSRAAADSAVVYATIRNRAAVPDQLDDASSPFAKNVRLHDSNERGLRSPGSVGGMAMPMAEVMSMRVVTSIPIPALGTTTLEPGGYHLMLDLFHSVRSGDRIPLRLHFAHAGWIVTTSHVR